MVELANHKINFQKYKTKEQNHFQKCYGTRHLKQKLQTFSLRMLLGNPIMLLWGRKFMIITQLEAIVLIFASANEFIDQVITNK